MGPMKIFWMGFRRENHPRAPSVTCTRSAPRPPPRCPRQGHHLAGTGAAPEVRNLPTAASSRVRSPWRHSAEVRHRPSRMRTRAARLARTWVEFPYGQLRLCVPNGVRALPGRRLAAPVMPMRVRRSQRGAIGLWPCSPTFVS